MFVRLTEPELMQVTKALAAKLAGTPLSASFDWSDIWRIEKRCEAAQVLGDLVHGEVGGADFQHGTLGRRLSVFGRRLCIGGRQTELERGG